MSNSFIGEIRLTPYNFTIEGWASCDGQVLNISQNTALFSLLGTTYGGSGVSNFGLPNLRSRIPVGQGTSTAGGTYSMGEVGGTEQATVNLSQIPAHNHPALAVSAAGTTASPAGAAWAGSALAAYSTATPAAVPMASTVLTATGNTQLQPHENRMPFLALNFQISLYGTFPSRS